MTTTDLTTNSLVEVCGRARPELACLGELAAPLVAVVGVVEQVGAGRGVDALADPTFALDVFTAAGPGGDPAVVGRVLDFLRARIDTPASQPASEAVAGSARRPVTLADAAGRYKTTALALLAATTQAAYWPWIKRLVAAHGDEDSAVVTAGDLKDLIAGHILANRTESERGRSGRSAEAMAVSAYRHFWGYLGDKRWATDNVAARLRKPSQPESRRRGWRPDEAALVRHLARGLNRVDPLLDEVTLCLSERMGLRREESRRVRICDVDLERAVIQVWGKGDKHLPMPIPPVFCETLRVFIEQRRPADITPEAWLRSDEHLLRYKPTEQLPYGRRVGAKRVDRIFEALRKAAPALFEGDDELVLHCYRHALGNWCEINYRRTVARRVLRHTSDQDPTDRYLKATLEDINPVLAAYEQYLLAADPHHQPAQPQPEPEGVAA
jgi:integrase